MPQWTTKDIPAQNERVAIVTGTGGLGFETALQLALAGAEVIIAGRNAIKGAQAIAKIRLTAPGSAVRFEQVDLADLKSIRGFAERLKINEKRIDLLVNNAAVMTPPNRQQTVDGFELQFGTNYLGHFALTALLMPLLKKGTNTRVVTVSSIASRQGILNFDDLQANDYESMAVYSQSKLANLMFALELQKRSQANGWGITSIAAHPGISRTDLLHNAPGKWSVRGIARTFLWFLFQPVEIGALPTLYAATAPLAQPGGYYGPGGLAELRGYPTVAKIPQQALNQRDAQRLFDESERLAAVGF